MLFQMFNPIEILLLLILYIFYFSFKFIDFDLSDDDTCKATIRMFLQCNLVQQFQIPYHVRIENDSMILIRQTEHLHHYANNNSIIT